MDTLTNKIMKRVRVIFVMRTLAFPFIVFATGLVTILFTVSIFDVFKNMITVISTNDIRSFAIFFIEAFNRTELLVQASVILALVFGIYTTSKFIKVFKHGVSFA